LVDRGTLAAVSEPDNHRHNQDRAGDSAPAKDGVHPAVELKAEAQLSTMFGHFTIRGYARGDEECVALVRGAIKGQENVLVRIQSSCLFGESFHATDCDCSWQVTTSLGEINQEGRGILIYLFQEGRGIGIFEKIRAFSIEQEFKCDTVQAFERMGLKQSDFRTYDLAVDILRAEEVRSVRLLTNNPAKLNALIDHGIPAEGLALALEEKDFKKLTAHSSEEDTNQLINYLRVKGEKLGQKYLPGSTVPAAKRVEAILVVIFHDRSPRRLQRRPEEV
jgi:GTP cyclohydrolase II